MSLRFAVVHESQADFQTSTELADRVLVAEVDWLDEALLDSQREWIGKDQLGSLTWKSIPNRARELGIRVHGHFDGQPGLPDAQAGRRAIAYILRRFSTIDAILLVRDTDDQQERRNGLEQARATYSTAARIVLGVAIPERECWVISGFDPEDGNEQKRLESETQYLGFNPCLRSHELTAGKDDQAKRSPKRVLAALTEGDRERERRCWRATMLTVLEKRGQANGLANYLGEIRHYIVPRITGGERNPEKP